MSKHDSTSDKADPEALATDKKAAKSAVAESESTESSATESEPVSAPASEIASETESVSAPASEAESETETETETESEPDPESPLEASPESVAETKSAAETPSETVPAPVSEPEPAPELTSRPVPEPVSKSETKGKPTSEPKALPKPRRSWFGLFNFLLILGLAAGGGYYWWQQQQIARDYTAVIAELKQQLAGKADNARLDAGLAGLSPLQGDIDGLGQRIDELGLGQRELRASSETLYELFGRDKNDWQLAEVEYLMRVAQHKLILQDDFEGAAITLQAASDKIGLTGDPGLLSVRVMVSDEIADLKTRKRADLVGMTLILAQMGRQVRVLKPGFPVRVEEVPLEVEAEVEPEIERVVTTLPDWFDRFIAFIDSLVEVRNEVTQPSEIEANTADVGASLEDNLKLARWAVLERDAHQYQLLMVQSMRLFREYYDLDNAANHEFMSQLQELQKMELKPEKPDITGSLYELQRILSQRVHAPEETPELPATETTPEEAPGPAATETTEPGNG